MNLKQSIYTTCGLILLLLVLALSSCSQEKKCLRYGAKLKALGCITSTSDTIVTHDTIKGIEYVKTFVSDTTHSIDTFYSDSLGVKVVTVVKWRTHNLTNFVKSKDTILKRINIEKKVFVEIPVYKIPWYIKLLIGSLIAICFLLAFKR
jgi:hypothetical protein